MSYKFKKNLKTIAICTYFIILSSALAFANKNGTDVGYYNASNILMNNLMAILIKFLFGLTLLTGLIAFILQIVKLNSYTSLAREKEFAIKNLLNVAITTAMASLSGLLFACLYYAISN